MTSLYQDFLSVIPECILLLTALTILMIATLKTPNVLTLSRITTLGGLTLSALALFYMPSVTALVFDGLMVHAPLGIFLRLFCDLLMLALVVVSWSHLKFHQLDKPELYTLQLLALLGMHVMIMAQDLMTLYLGIEMQSLALYVMVAYGRTSTLTTEAALKYFVLGALASVFILFGASFIYGSTGATGYGAISTALSMHAPETDLTMLYAGMTFALVGFAFKVSWAPFHLWTPDVYQGSPTVITAFLASLPKIAAFMVLISFLLQVMGPLSTFWQGLIVALASLSMLWGALGALAQSSLKRLMAYSTISHMGYASLAFLAPAQTSLYPLILYLVLYVVMTLGVFALLLCLRRYGEPMDKLQDLQGLATHHPMLAFMLAALLFSLAGIPPLAGFFAKYAIFQMAISAGHIAVALLGVLTSVVAAAYYLRVIKIMYFDQSVDPAGLRLDQPFSRGTLTVAGISTVVIVGYLAIPSAATLYLQQLGQVLLQTH